MGRWQENNLPWYETTIINCQLCGKMIPRKMWLVTYKDEELKFCDEACEQLYFDYWLPKYGPPQPG